MPIELGGRGTVSLNVYISKGMESIYSVELSKGNSLTRRIGGESVSHSQQEDF